MVSSALTNQSKQMHMLQDLHQTRLCHIQIINLQQIKQNKRLWKYCKEVEEFILHITKLQSEGGLVVS